MSMHQNVDPPTPQAFDEGLKALADRGLNWIAFVPLACGAPAPGGLEIHADSGLLLFLSLGPAFGEQTPYGAGLPTHSFDKRSADLTQAFAARFVLPNDSTAEQVYPGDSPLDLRRWLALGRVQYASPIGIGIRPDCGPWLAVRAAIWTRANAIPLKTLQQRYPPLPVGPSPCEQCTETPCITKCPPGALDSTHSPPGETSSKALSLCIDHRTEPNSNCAHQCLARLACPVGTESQYPEAQMGYHYGASLVTIQKWRRGRPHGRS